MSATERLYALRAAAEQGIVDCDTEISKRPSYALIYRRRYLARLAMLFHAKIERLEASYA